MYSIDSIQHCSFHDSLNLNFIDNEYYYDLIFAKCAKL